MVADKKQIKLQENIAAIRVDERSEMNQAIGVATVIPAGQVIELDDEVLSFAAGMRGVMWNGATYTLFLDDLVRRAKKNDAGKRVNC